jgi:hypothetical protein
LTASGDKDLKAEDIKNLKLNDEDDEDMQSYDEDDESNDEENDHVENWTWTDEDIEERYNLYGGIPRCIFADKVARSEYNTMLDAAISSFDADTILNIVRKGVTVSEKLFSHKVLCMVPDTRNYLSRSHLDFLSKDILDRVINQLHNDSLQKISSFILTNLNDVSGATATLKGRVYEMLCHRSFKQKKDIRLEIFSLDADSSSHTDQAEGEVIKLSSVKHEVFDALQQITIVQGCCTYYEPRSLRFGALDAFILDTTGPFFKCYCLQMTINASHGIKSAPLKKFIDWLNNQTETSSLHFIFVIPTDLKHQFKKQPVMTARNKVHKNPPTVVHNIYQYIYPLDVYFNQETQ